MKYLIDSLQSYENGYGDALCPTRLDTSKTFMGEGELTRPATLQDIHTLVGAVEYGLGSSSSHQQYTQGMNVTPTSFSGSPPGGAMDTMPPNTAPAHMSMAIDVSAVAPSPSQLELIAIQYLTAAANS